VLPAAHDVLPRAFRDADDGVPALVQDALHERGEAAAAAKCERDLRDEAHVDDPRRHRRLHRDEARLPPHEPHDADAAVGGRRLHFGRQQRALRLLDRGVEAETLVDEQDVVVDRFGHANDGTIDALPLALGLDGGRAGVAAVAADDEDHVDRRDGQPFDDRRYVRAPA
jgi:hypothetical protein